MALIYTAAIKDSALKISLKNTIYFVRLSVGHAKNLAKKMYLLVCCQLNFYEHFANQ